MASLFQNLFPDPCSPHPWVLSFIWALDPLCCPESPKSPELPLPLASSSSGATNETACPSFLGRASYLHGLLRLSWLRNTNGL